MKNVFFIIALCLCTTAILAQKGSGFGLKAGLNFNRNGDLVEFVTDDFVGNVTDSDSRAGFHVGFFGKIQLPGVYIRPEVFFTRTTSSYDLDGIQTDLTISRADLPVLVGFKVIGPVHVFAGPAFQFIFQDDLEEFVLDEVENEFTIGLHAGVGVNLGNLGIDLRYERGFTENEAAFISTNITDISGRVDSRPEQLILSLSYKFSK